MRLDLVLEPDRPNRFESLGRLAEELNFGCVWTANHVAAPDPFMAFMPLANTSSKILMGPVAVSPFEIHPVKIANQLLTLNEQSKGRARVVIGGGGAIIAMGLKPGRRAMMPRMVRAVRETIDIVRGAARDKPLSYDGDLYAINGYSADWAKAEPPLVYAAATKPQMMKMAGQSADGAMFSDATLPRIKECVDALHTSLKESQRATDNFPISNLYTWHVKADRRDALAEARAKLFVRGMLEPWYLEPFLPPDECNFVDEHLVAFAKAYANNTPDIEGVPDPLIEQLVDNLTFCGDFSDVDKFTGQLIQFKEAGVTEFAIRLYSEPEESMRLIAERVMPELT
ncbi:MAG: LLM class flavin-dependent oxidoreductase [Pseudomonadota bacterium]|nr:LLM class flavin-dependent oxidoreductase [Pseudomonadota bacterium]